MPFAHGANVITTAIACKTPAQYVINGKSLWTAEMQ